MPVPGSHSYEAFKRGYSLMVKLLPSKQVLSVRFRLAAPVWGILQPANVIDRDFVAEDLQLASKTNGQKHGLINLGNHFLDLQVPARLSGLIKAKDGPSHSSRFTPI